ncbi:hypothetical protein [Larkinella insperata]|nr:hypothetical protein [Larkinella insperata]
MMFHITFADFKTFCLCATIEVGLDTLNAFLASGKNVHSALLIEKNGNRTELPLDAFRGPAFAQGMLQIEEQYQEVLAVRVWDYHYTTARVIRLQGNVSYAMQTAKRVEEEKKNWKRKADRLFARMDRIEEKIQLLKS